MPVKGAVPWPCLEHTKAKHDIYRRYLERWYPILMNGPKAYASVTYAEGFAGPGVYSGGEPGSPVIAMKALVEKLPPDKGVARFLFIDDDQRCADMLPGQLRAAFPARPRPSHTMPAVVIKKGTCADHLESELTNMRAWGQPIFANLDSWGNAPVPYQLLKRLAANVSSEVIVTLLPQHFVRFVSDMGNAGDEVFGGDPRWRSVADLTPKAKSQHILTCYRQALKNAGFKFLLDFELIPTHGQLLYLVFGTSHRRGLEKMKDSLWEVDRAEGVGFRDPRDEQAETLFAMDDPVLGPLTRLLEQKLRTSGPIRVEDLREFTLFETVYRREHVLSALRPLVRRGVLKVNGPLRLSSIVELAPAKAP